MGMGTKQMHLDNLRWISKTRHEGRKDHCNDRTRAMSKKLLTKVNRLDSKKEMQFNLTQMEADADAISQQMLMDHEAEGEMLFSDADRFYYDLDVPNRAIADQLLPHLSLNWVLNLNN